MNRATFRTAVVRIPAGPDSIEIIDVPVVDPGLGEVRIQVATAPVNPVDLGVAGGFFHRLGLINQPDHTGLGWDFAGTIIATGSAVDLFVGTRVAGVVIGFDRDFGAYAEQLIVPASDGSWPSAWMRTLSSVAARGGRVETVQSPSSRYAATAKSIAAADSASIASIPRW